MDDVIVARVVHVLAIVHWIGGVMLVTLVILPAAGRLAEPERRIAVFEEIEGRFSRQAKLSVILAGLSGFWMIARLDAWDRFAGPQSWWMYAMVAVWLVFAFVLFVAEPLFLHDWVRRRAAVDSDRTFAVVLRAHQVVVALSLITLGGAIAGAHGMYF